MKAVLDSSVAFKSIVKEKDSSKAIQLLREFWQAKHEFVVPDVFPYELARALTRAERQQRLVRGDAIVHWANIMVTPPLIVHDLTLVERGIEIASKNRIGVYDCVYVALAEREGCEFITADGKLIAHLQSQFPFIVDLATLP
jgi:predicted nucleic acid-binding protein